MIELVSFIYLGKSKYKINTEYSVWIKFINNAGNFSKGALPLEKFLLFLYDDIFIDKPNLLQKLFSAVEKEANSAAQQQLIQTAMERIILPLYEFAKTPDSNEKQDDNAEFRANIEVFDFAKDWKYIDLSFLNYGIDLYSNRLHWWRFMWLLKAIILDSFREIVGYRSLSNDRIAKMSKQEQKFYKSKKQVYSLSKHRDKTANEHWADMKKYIEKRHREAGIIK